MIFELSSRAWTRLRPAEGWFPFFLLVAVVATVISAVVAVEWVPEGNVFAWAALFGLLLGATLAKRPLGWRAAWTLILLYGLATNLIFLGGLVPSPGTILAGWDESSSHIRQSWGLFADRAAGWLEAVLGTGRSEETIVFAYGLGLLVWLVAAYAAWSTFRQHRPLAGLGLMAFALGANTYLGDGPLWPAAFFVGLAALLAAVVHQVDMEQSWDARETDYSGEIRLDLIYVSSGIGLVLLSLALVLPAINIRELTRALLDRPAVHEFEETLSQAFAGVRQPQPDDGVGPGGEPVAVSAGLPRSFLLGNAPELYETLVMTATVEGPASRALHWRGLSYDTYTGRGWAVSAEREEPAGPDTTIPLPQIQSWTALSQTVQWQQGDTTTRYTLGLPLRFDHAVSVFWRGREDLSRVQGSGNRYQALSRVSEATAADLRQQSQAEAPPAILARYTQLPDSVPERVRSLAHEVAGDPAVVNSVYDQAKTLERFLRQYPYSLDVELPLAGADPVEFFLFELQAGYCDYYASAMVVMARVLGIPARLAAGFLAQPADEHGVQSIYQINAHSWAEIYVAGYGWIEFEPTAAFPAGGALPETSLVTEAELDGLVPGVAPPPIPEPTGGFSRLSPLWGLALAALILLGWGLWHRRQRRLMEVDGVLWVYGRLLRYAQKLGQSTPPSQTPAEFARALSDWLAHIRHRSRLADRLLGGSRPAGTSGDHTAGATNRPVASEIERLAAMFQAQQYGGLQGDGNEAMERWRTIRRRIWLLRIVSRTAR